MARLALLLVASLVTVPAVSADAMTPWLAFDFEGVHAANGLCESQGCLVTHLGFELPEGTSDVRLDLLATHREVLEVQSMFDIYLVPPSGRAYALFHNGLAPLGIYNCWIPEPSCEFEGDRTTAIVPAEPGEWRVAYRGVHVGDLSLAISLR